MARKMTRTAPIPEGTGSPKTRAAERVPMLQAAEDLEKQTVVESRKDLSKTVSARTEADEIVDNHNAACGIPI